MKILQIANCFYPSFAYGGVPRYTYELSKELVKRGHEVCVYTTDAYNINSRLDRKQEIIDNIDIRRFRNINNYLAYHHKVFIAPDIVNVIKENIKKIWYSSFKWI